MKARKLLLFTFLFLFSANQTLAAFCQGPILPCGREGTPACQLCHVFVLIINIINFIMKCLTPIAASLMLVISGLMLIISHFSDGGPQLVSSATKMVTATIVGLVIIFISWILLNTVFTELGFVGWQGFGNWWDFTDKCQIGQ